MSDGLKKILAALIASGIEGPYSIENKKYRSKKVPLYCECGGRVKYNDNKSVCQKCGKEW